MNLKNKYASLLIIMFLSQEGKAQYTYQTAVLLHKLDSIRSSSSVAKYFADIYFATTANAVLYFSNADTSVQKMMGRMELRFADYFLRSADAHEKKLPIPGEWKTYYADKNASSLRYILFGINAHINGDIWQALTNEFSKEEIQELKPHYFAYYQQLLREYRLVYDQAFIRSKRLRVLHTISFGMDELYGKIMLKRWRKRQMQLAELYFDDKPLFDKKLKRLRKKMDRLDDLIRRNT
ncbi:MAG: hypothetical protein JNN00_11260 [Chitinophagaceae bacterium]|nr:hypothetical protein [Chitinophagaceae bacterium]